MFKCKTLFVFYPIYKFYLIDIKIRHTVQKFQTLVLGFGVPTHDTQGN